MIFRNVHWIFGRTDFEEAVKHAGLALYQIVVPRDRLNCLVDFKDGQLCLPPWQVLQFVGSFLLAEEQTPLKKVTAFKFIVCDDYKNHVTWQRKSVIKGLKK